MGSVRKQGDNLYLSIQLGDRAVNVGQTRIFCSIKDTSGVVIDPLFEIFHTADGLYSENVKTMPLNDEIVVTYFINRLDGVTPSNKYDPNVYSEIFMRDVTGEIVEENLDKKVSEVSVSVAEIEGQVFEDSFLNGAVSDGELLQGTLESDLIVEGEVLDEC